MNIEPNKRLGTIDMNDVEYGTDGALSLNEAYFQLIISRDIAIKGVYHCVDGMYEVISFRMFILARTQ
jgi:hypothetical protein